MPRVRLVDMEPAAARPRRLPCWRRRCWPRCRKRIARGEQSLLLLNRRGYAPVLHCGACGWKSGCPHCSAWRVFHKADRTLRCHHCGFTERVPRACPDCGNLDIAPLGRGTEKLQEQLAELLPGARIARIDADSTRLKGALEQQLQAVHAGEVDVLVGTQMVAKGHDFRRMTLVAAVNPDGALFSSDFRAPERLFALLMQAAGRAGRDAGRPRAARCGSRPGTRATRCTRRWAHDFAAFAAASSTSGARRPAALCRLALLRAEAREAAVAQAFLQDASSAGALPEGAAVTVYPPVPPRWPRWPTWSACRCWWNRPRARAAAHAGGLAAAAAGAAARHKGCCAGRWTWTRWAPARPAQALGGAAQEGAAASSGGSGRRCVAGSSCALGTPWRCIWRWRAAATRAATAALGSPSGSAISSAGRTAGTSTCRSMRSSSGPDSLPW
jgi:primosomal protein N'